MLQRRPSLNTNQATSATEHKSEPDVAFGTMLRPRDVASMLSITPATLRSWRSGGKGPRFVRCSRSVTRYPSDALRSWIESGASPAMSPGQL